MPRPTKTSREYLEYQADRIESVLAAHRVPARVAGGAVSPRWLRYEVAAGASARIATVRNLSEEIALALGADQARVTRQGNVLAVEVPRPDPEPVTLRRMLPLLSSVPPVTAVLGLSELGRPLLIRLPSPDVAHILVAGTTGSGKTELLRTLLLSLALTNRPAQVQFVLIDPKQRGLGPLAQIPHCLFPLMSDPQQAGRVLAQLVTKMERRDRTQVNTPHIVIAVDEVLDLMMTGGSAVMTALTRLAQRGREAGIHLVLGAQKPSSTVFDGQLKANFPVRLVGRVVSADDARIAAGIGGTGAEKLLGRGDFLAVSANSVTRFQAAHVPQSDWRYLLQAIRMQRPLVGQPEETVQ